MDPVRKSPSDVAAALAHRSRLMGNSGPGGASWKRATFTLPRSAARDKAREWFERYPKAAYMTEIEFWRETDDGSIEFTIRRLPTAD